MKRIWVVSWVVVSCVLLTAFCSPQVTAQEKIERGLWAVWLGDPFPGYLSYEEKQKMLGIGATYLEACIPNDSVYMHFCDSTNGVITMCIEGPPEPILGNYQKLWAYINDFNPPDTAMITQYIQAMYDAYGDHVGLRTYMIMHETASADSNKNYFMQYACQQVHAIDANPNHKTLVVTYVEILNSNPNFFDEVPDLDIFNLDKYPFYYDCPYEGPTFQQALDGLIAAYQTTKDATDDRRVVWQALIQTHGSGDPATFYFRLPTRQEIFCQAFLALTRGAKGVLGFTYGSWHGPSEYYYGPLTPDREIAHYDSRPGDSLSTLYQDEADLFSVLDSIGGVMYRVKSQLAFNSRDVPQDSYIHSVTGDEVINGKGTVEVGTFIDTTVSPQLGYFMLVNRKCLTSEDQNVTVYLDSTDIGDAKMWYVIDQFSQDTTFTGAIDGEIPFTTHLEPGEGKLFKVVPFPDSAFHGTASPLNWQGGIMVDGDVTVDSGKTLAILPPAEITFYANTDVLGTWDPQDCDFVVNGGLRAEGTEADSIVFTSTETNPNDWEGIKVTATSHCGMRLAHCIIEHAYCGIELSNHCQMDTISFSRFFNNQTWGVLVVNSGCLIADNVVGYDPALQGGSRGIQISNDDSVRASLVTRNDIQDYWFGIRASLCPTCSTEISANSISTGKTPDATGIYCSWGYNLWIEDVTVTGDSLLYGLDLQESSAEISHLRVNGNPSYPVRFGARFYVDKGSVMRDSEIDDFLETGVLSEYSIGGAWPDLGTEGDQGMNKVVSDTGIFVRFLSSKRQTDSLMARYNWWGEYPPDPDRFLGKVAYMPALTSEPEEPDSLQLKVAVSGEAPKQFELEQNYPNPFNPVTSIQLAVGSLQSPSHITLKIYNTLGQLVRTLVDEEKAEGSYTVYWDGRNQNGKEVSSGVYFYRLEAGDFAEVKKMVLLR